ncbi:SDR family NAD(P)-dependent oxidoreductase [Streptomyces sp. NPDC047999]|uniref:SDR family NAD(P)-dependent oxidoreductase n=1 Tax=Streptomyces sp. NPDC047999 TaxID=3365497 RepID=UPI003713A2C1
MRSYPVEDKVVLVTGAARGIGAAVARRLAADGAKVALLGRRSDALWTTMRSCGPRAMAWEADITDELAMRAAVTGVAEHFGGIDVLVANAGVCQAEVLCLGDQDTAWNVIEVNLVGTLRTLRLCMPHLLDRKGYCLVVSSVSALVPAPGLAAYSASKAAGAQLARSLGAEVRHRGVGVGTAYFSLVDTSLLHGLRRHPALGLLEFPWPISRTSSPETVADAVSTGIRQRAEAVYLPKWVRWLDVARGPLAPATRLVAARFGAALDRAAADAADPRPSTDSSPHRIGQVADRPWRPGS